MRLLLLPKRLLLLLAMAQWRRMALVAQSEAARCRRQPWLPAAPLRRRGEAEALAAGAAQARLLAELVVQLLLPLPLPLA